MRQLVYIESSEKIEPSELYAFVATTVANKAGQYGMCRFEIVYLDPSKHEREIELEREIQSML